MNKVDNREFEINIRIYSKSKQSVSVHLLRSALPRLTSAKRIQIQLRWN